MSSILLQLALSSSEQCSCARDNWVPCSMSAKKNTEEEDARDGGEKLHYISVIKKLSF